MLSTNNYVPILVAAALHVGIGYLWLSNTLFGKMWLGDSKITSPNTMRLILQAKCSILIATALMIGINIFHQTQNTTATASGFAKMFSWFLTNTDQGPTMMNAMKVAGFFWMGLSLPTIGSLAIWLNYPMQNFLLYVSGELVALLAMAASLSYLSNLMA